MLANLYERIQHLEEANRFHKMAADTPMISDEKKLQSRILSAAQLLD